MNWTWTIRGRDGGMNGLEFARCTTAGGVSRVLIHAAPAMAEMEVRSDSDQLIARGDIARQGDYSPMTLVEIDGANLRRSEVWPDATYRGTLVLLAGGEAGLLRTWEHAPDHSWWRWTVRFANHVGRPEDWSPQDAP